MPRPPWARGSCGAQRPSALVQGAEAREGGFGDVLVRVAGGGVELEGDDLGIDEGADALAQGLGVGGEGEIHGGRPP